MKIYVDTEFSQFYGAEFDTKLISVGLVAEDGKELYIELVDHYTEEECSDFVISELLPILEPEKFGMTAPEACKKIREFVESYGGDQVVRLVCDSPSYDFDLVVELFRECGEKWPYNLKKKPIYLSAGLVDGRIYEFFKKNPTYSKHHALYDAKALAYADPDSKIRQKEDAAKKLEEEGAAKKPGSVDGEMPPWAGTPWTPKSRKAYDGEIDEVRDDAAFARIVYGKNINQTTLTNYLFFVISNSDMRVLCVTGFNEHNEAVLSTNIEWICKNVVKTREGVYFLSEGGENTTGQPDARQVVLIERAKYSWFSQAEGHLQPKQDYKDYRHRFATEDELAKLVRDYKPEIYDDREPELFVTDYVFVVIHNGRRRVICVIGKNEKDGSIFKMMGVGARKGDRVYKSAHLPRGNLVIPFKIANAYNRHDLPQEYLEKIESIKSYLRSADEFGKRAAEHDD